MDAIERLLATEEIKNVKARYFRFIDTKDNERFLEQFTEDAHWLALDAEGNVQIDLNSRDELGAFLAPMTDARLEGFSVHQGHTPEIDIIDDRTATGVWAFSDYIRLPGLNMYGYGHYHEEYRKCDDGVWRISKSRVTRLHIDELEPGGAMSSGGEWQGWEGASSSN
jgi:uncharacterized protein (TIGR02246 family)